MIHLDNRKLQAIDIKIDEIDEERTSIEAQTVNDDPFFLPRRIHLQRGSDKSVLDGKIKNFKRRITQVNKTIATLPAVF